ncbi:MAG: hypothetical protein ABS79_04505 [Planctomycetes bacterium SCN 63-9]|nr:MAG: hypothetical protein ABS79_04505 [Planctomycetes bacterium SCN 63-9]
MLTLALLTLLVGLPELAFGQQSGLFPNAPIRRVRPPCDQEDSVYKLYRQQYYGYHPTCWRKFPDGWGCPSPEAPDKEKSFREIKKTPPVNPDMEPEDRDEPGNEPANDMDRPADRPGPSPFDLPAVPEGTKPPFQPDAPDQGGGPGVPPANAPRASRSPFSPRSGSPELTPPDSGRTTTSNRSRQRTRDDGDDRPVLAMADEVSESDAANTELSPVEEGGEVPTIDVPQPSAKPAQPAARRGMLSGLFAGSGWNWRRR